jgi:microcystin-dependent protein
MSFQGQPPQFQGNLQDWSKRLSEYLIRLQQEFGSSPTSPINLTHRIGQEKAVQDGTMMFDPVTGEINFAHGGQWRSPGLPSGAIVLWSGALVDIPSGWLLCDGTDGTPDLRGKFIVGAGGTYDVGDTGGADTVALTTAELPAHTHGVGTYSAVAVANHTHNVAGNTGGISANHTHTVTFYRSVGGGTRVAPQMGVTGNNSPENVNSGTVSSDHSHGFNVTSGGGGGHGHSITGASGSVGSGTAHENRPPYYALAYIMKA